MSNILESYESPFFYIFFHILSFFFQVFIEKQKRKSEYRLHFLKREYIMR